MMGAAHACQSCRVFSFSLIPAPTIGPYGAANQTLRRALAHRRHRAAGARPPREKRKVHTFGNTYLVKAVFPVAVGGCGFRFAGVRPNGRDGFTAQGNGLAWPAGMRR